MNEQGSHAAVTAFTRRKFMKMAAVAALGSAVCPTFAFADEIDDLNAEAEEKANQADEFSNQKDELNAQAEEMEGDLAIKQAENDEMRAKLAALQQQVNDALVAYDEANKNYEAAVVAADEAQVALDDAEAHLDEIQDQLSNRVNDIYRQGNPNVLDVLFSATSFHEFATSWDAMRRIGEQDAMLVQESKDARQAAEDARDEMERQEQIKADELAKALAAKEELEAAEAQLQAEVDQLTEDIADLELEIEQVRIDAEEAARLEEEARKASEEALAAAKEEQERRAREAAEAAAAAAAAAEASAASSYSGGYSDVPSIAVDGWVNPAPGKYVTSPFGWRAFTGTFHQGVDLSCSYETCYAMAAGVVSFTGWLASTSGLTVAINHGSGIVSWYLHGSETLVGKGAEVYAGQPIMITGNTGHSTGPHLHFQINVNSPDGVYGTAVNPAGYFSW